MLFPPGCGADGLCEVYLDRTRDLTFRSIDQSSALNAFLWSQTVLSSFFLPDYKAERRYRILPFFLADTILVFGQNVRISKETHQWYWEENKVIQPLSGIRHDHLRHNERSWKGKKFCELDIYKDKERKTQIEEFGEFEKHCFNFFWIFHFEWGKESFTFYTDVPNYGSFDVFYGDCLKEVVQEMPLWWEKYIAWNPSIDHPGKKTRHLLLLLKNGGGLWHWLDFIWVFWNKI